MVNKSIIPLFPTLFLLFVVAFSSVALADSPEDYYLVLG